jgi:hypothetical protein
MIIRRGQGLLARKKVEELREEEMVFLGMQRAPKTEEEKNNDPLEAREQTKNLARERQLYNHQKYEMDRKEIQKEILEVEGYDIKDEMLRERRDWILQQ